MQENKERQEMYRPIVAITKITARHTMGRIPISTTETPNCICGMARRVGYTGTHDSDLAIYRLKVKTHTSANAMMLPTLFVVDGGLFVEYDLWQKERERSTD